MDATHTEQWRKWNIENAMRAMTVFIHVQRSCNVYHRFWIGETERNKTIIMQKKHVWTILIGKVWVMPRGTAIKDAG